MKILLDHNLPKRLKKFLGLHNISTTAEMGWEQLTNGDLLKNAAQSGFDAFLTIDKKMEHERNLANLPLPIIVIDAYSNALDVLLPFAPFIAGLTSAPLLNELYVIQASGAVRQIGFQHKK